MVVAPVLAAADATLPSAARPKNAGRRRGRATELSHGVDVAAAGTRSPAQPDLRPGSASAGRFHALTPMSVRLTLGTGAGSGMSCLRAAPQPAE